MTNRQAPSIPELNLELPELPETFDLPELPETFDLPELPDSLDLPELDLTDCVSSENVEALPVRGRYFILRPVGTFDTWAGAWAALQLAHTPNIPEPNTDGSAMVGITVTRQTTNNAATQMAVMVGKQDGRYTVAIGPWCEGGFDSTEAEQVVKAMQGLGMEDTIIFDLQSLDGGTV